MITRVVNNFFVQWLLKLMKDPKVNLVVNGSLMLFVLGTGVVQYLAGNTTSAFTLFVSGFGYSTAIVFWLVILFTGGVKHTPKNSRSPSSSLPEELT